ncbi:uncharacterized protein METZ01_LOCUS48792 [marine metagenome]|uniref:Uncharacterized protein n=1 Tax=marine metagenome TaxID=408172 RepID=A0A381RY30_9ZZZZ
MKKISIAILILLNISYSQSTSSLESWENILQTPELVEYFKGIFNSLGVIVEETNEKFTINHTGNSFEFEMGINEEKVDFVVPAKLQNIQNMIAHSQDGKISLEESWRIMDVLFTPLTRVTLQTPVLSINWRRKLAGVEDLTHVYLINPTGGEASKHTLIYVKGQWLVLKGTHGKPRRTYRMNPEQAIEYQREIFAAMQKDTFWAWWKFASYYKKWRKTCSVTHKL